MRSLSRRNGANLGEPHTGSMGNGLYEMRLKGAEGIARVFYCTIVERRIVMLHCFVKKRIDCMHDGINAHRPVANPLPARMRTRQRFAPSATRNRSISRV
ncbi:hypothetical protein WS50_08775 [Burkholderia territorii]|nr:hypothetical protein WS47_03630 [Burkholderia territorii]KUZ21064.1 hypothetical protein WS50_08775 [Burkholderia territorii]